MASARILGAVAIGLFLAAGCNAKDPAEPPVSKEPEPVALPQKEIGVTPPTAEAVVVPAPSASTIPTIAPAPPAPAAVAKVASRLPSTVKEPAPSASPTPSPSAVASAPSPPSKAPALLKRGPAASGEGFSVWLETRAAHAVGQNATVTAVITAKSPYKCNDKYPYKLKLDPPGAGVSYPTPVVTSAQIGKERTTMPFSVATSAKGTPVVSGTLSFSVCTEDRCLVEKQKVSVGFAVE